MMLTKNKLSCFKITLNFVFLLSIYNGQKGRGQILKITEISCHNYTYWNQI